MARFDLISGVRGAKDIIEKPNRKNINPKYLFSFFVNTDLSKFFKTINSQARSALLPTWDQMDLLG